MLDFILTALTFVVPFVLVLGLVVTIHELGHFLAAKMFGVAIDRFSIGFGKAIASWTDKSGVEWRVGWIPLGGYVRFTGDENASSVPDSEDLDTMRRTIERREGHEAVARYFHFKPLWQRAIVVAAGPIANFVLAVALFASLLLTFGQYVLPAKIASVQPGSPAEQAGFRAGDLIVEADGRRIRGFDEVAEIVQVRANVPTAFVVQRSGADITLEATPRWVERTDSVAGTRRQGMLGLIPAQTRDDFEHVRYNPVEAVAGGVQRTWRTLETTVYYLGRMITGQVSPDQLSGPLGIARISGKVAQAGAEGAPDVGGMILGSSVNLLQLAAFVSVSIGFMNLLPIPVLDGGHLLFYAYEAVARRPLAARIQAAGYRVGLALLLGLMLFATWNDLQQLRVFKILGGVFS
ncbi:regulator of sigma E protease [Phenylobacterium haematophilum]|uniref:Zinc metalloprotease n=1 Tax=Phenylobacterium haematophilum TaxID=98513 RepID=A0A839ZYI0_9CAUL|nr:RIP metalloprotease RseP [Phenylobacterium haematophilum]MBB3890207.1 regulator of sigma E protease [Phenylobacterium haematophilum]